MRKARLKVGSQKGKSETGFRAGPPGALVVLSTLSAKEALIEIIPRFLSETGLTVNITYVGASILSQREMTGLEADIFIGPEELSDRLIESNTLTSQSRSNFATSRSGAAFALRTPRPDISTAKKLIDVLLDLPTISYSAGSSGIHFVKVLERYGVAEPILAKRIAPAPGEPVASIVARGDAAIGIQQIGELLPIPGVQVLDLPPEFEKTMTYSATMFSRSTHKQGLQALIDFLHTNESRKILRKKGLHPV